MYLADVTIINSTIRNRAIARDEDSYIAMTYS